LILADGGRVGSEDKHGGIVVA